MTSASEGLNAMLLANKELIFIGLVALGVIIIIQQLYKKKLKDDESFDDVKDDMDDIAFNGVYRLVMKDGMDIDAELFHGRGNKLGRAYKVLHTEMPADDMIMAGEKDAGDFEDQEERPKKDVAIFLHRPDGAAGKLRSSIMGKLGRKKEAANIRVCLEDDLVEDYDVINIKKDVDFTETRDMMVRKSVPTMNVPNEQISKYMRESITDKIATSAEKVAWLEQQHASEMGQASKMAEILKEKFSSSIADV